MEARMEWKEGQQRRLAGLLEQGGRTLLRSKSHCSGTSPDDRHLASHNEWHEP